MRGLTLLTLGALAVAVTVTVLRDPEEPWAVAIFVIALGTAAGALATMYQLRSRGRTRRRPGAVARALAARRGMEVAAVVSLLLWLRAIDGLSLLTATFVIATFAVTEAVLSARPASSR